MSSDGKDFAKGTRKYIKDLHKDMKDGAKVLPALIAIAGGALWLLDQYLENSDDSDNSNDKD